jgi:hypothetical protein
MKILQGRWRWLGALGMVVLASGCLPVLPPKTVVEPQPAPLCGDVQRPYTPPKPGPIAPVAGAAPAPVEAQP